MKTFFVSFLLVFVRLGAHAGEDSVFVRFDGDTVQLWNTRAHVNCCSRFAFDVWIIMDTIVWNEHDTSKNLCNCLCYFDLSTSLVGLGAGSYVVQAYRSQLYPSDTTLLIGSTSFTIGGSASSLELVRQYQSTCGGQPVGVERNENFADHAELEFNYPNPFNPTTDFRFRIPARPAGGADLGFVSLKVYDVLGREVATLVNEVKLPGEYTVRWDASSAAGGAP